MQKMLTLRLDDTEYTALRSHAKANRMSMVAVIKLSLDSKVPGFRKPEPAIKPKASDINVDTGDLVFDED